MKHIGNTRKLQNLNLQVESGNFRKNWGLVFFCFRFPEDLALLLSYSNSVKRSSRAKRVKRQTGRKSRQVATWLTSLNGRKRVCNPNQEARGQNRALLGIFNHFVSFLPYFFGFFFAILFCTLFWNVFFASSWTFNTATILGITSVGDSEFETEKRDISQLTADRQWGAWRFGLPSTTEFFRLPSSWPGLSDLMDLFVSET